MPSGKFTETDWRRSENARRSRVPGMAFRRRSRYAGAAGRRAADRGRRCPMSTFADGNMIDDQDRDQRGRLQRHSRHAPPGARWRSSTLSGHPSAMFGSRRTWSTGSAIFSGPARATPTSSCGWSPPPAEAGRMIFPTPRDLARGLAWWTVSGRRRRPGEMSSCGWRTTTCSRIPTPTENATWPLRKEKAAHEPRSRVDQGV